MYLSFLLIQTEHTATILLLILCIMHILEINNILNERVRVSQKVNCE